MIICDTHCDTLYRIVEEKNPNLDINYDILKNAGITLQVFAMFVGPNTDISIIRNRNEKMLNAFDKIVSEGIKKCINPGIIKEGYTYGMLSLEGCEAIRNDEDINYYFSKGIRMASVTWNHENAFGYPSCSNIKYGLKEHGLRLLKNMEQLGIAVDTSHLNDAGFYDVIDKLEYPPLASHSNSRSICNHVRNLSDTQLKLLFSKEGYVGINLCPLFLNESGNANLDDIVDHIIHMMNLGGENYIGMGSDFDGISSKPDGLKNPLDYSKLFERMQARGIDKQNITKFAGKNFVDYFNRLKHINIEEE